jgi:hypothetical protein
MVYENITQPRRIIMSMRDAGKKGDAVIFSSDKDKKEEELKEYKEGVKDRKK